VSSDDLPDWVRQQRWEIGARLRRLRLAQSLSQVDLANRAGLDHKTVSRLENGTYNVGVDYLTRIARALNVETWQLFKDG
jgi:transcriptional regulator with XRE-family HTH domain